MAWHVNVQLANCPFDALARSVKGYAAYGVPPHKLVYGLPWYGYTYPCANNTPGAVCAPPCPGGDVTAGQNICGQVTYAWAVECQQTGTCSTGNGATPVAGSTAENTWQYDSASVSVR